MLGVGFWPRSAVQPQPVLWRCDGVVETKRSASSPRLLSWSLRIPDLMTDSWDVRIAPKRASRHLGPPCDDAFRSRPHLRRGQTGSHRLVAGGSGIRSDAGRRAMIGWAENDRLVGADGGQVQD